MVEQNWEMVMLIKLVPDLNGYTEEHPWSQWFLVFSICICPAVVNSSTNTKVQEYPRLRFKFPQYSTIDLTCVPWMLMLAPRLGLISPESNEKLGRLNIISALRSTPLSFLVPLQRSSTSCAKTPTRIAWSHPETILSGSCRVSLACVVAGVKRITKTNKTKESLIIKTSWGLLIKRWAALNSN